MYGKEKTNPGRSPRAYGSFFSMYASSGVSFILYDLVAKKHNTIKHLEKDATTKRIFILYPLDTLLTPPQKLPMFTYGNYYGR